MKETRQIEGIWYIHGQDHPPVYGVLTYDPESGLSLNATAVQEISLLEVFHNAQRGSEIQETIYGTDKNQKTITLLGCGCEEANSATGLQTYRIRPLKALLGLKIADWNSPLFRSATIEFSLLNDWLGISGIKVGGKSPFGVSVTPHSDISVHLPDNVVLRIGYGYSTRTKSGAFSIEEFHVITFGFSDNTSPNDIAKYIETFRRFLTFFTGELVFYDSVKYSVHPIEVAGIDEAEALHSNFGASTAKRELFALFTLIPYSQIEAHAPEIIRQWFQYHERLDAVLELYFSVIFHSTGYGNLDFLLLAQALEAYHNLNPVYESAVEAKAQFKTRRQRIVDSAPEEERSWLKEKLHHANQKTLAQRLTDILQQHAGIIARFITDTKTFADKIRHTRNYHTHFDPDLLQGGKVATGVELFELTFQMRALLEICILSDLGIKGGPIERIIQRVQQVRVISA